MSTRFDGWGVIIGYFGLISTGTKDNWRMLLEFKLSDFSLVRAVHFHFHIGRNRK